MLSVVGVVLGAAVLVLLGLSWYWSREPKPLWVNEKPPTRDAPVVGYSTTDTLIRVVEWMLNKPGGYLSNDIAPPGVWLDNMPNFEFGVLVQARDLARVLRNDYSRSQSQSTEDKDLAIAEPALNFSNDSWLFPTTESKYREAIVALDSYRARLVDENLSDARFYARADNLREWLFVVERRLGSLSQRLSASVSRPRVNIDLAGDPAARESTARPEDIDVRTPWLQLDDVFYEARGTAWALLLFMRAAQFDFEGVLEDKNAVVSLRQIIRELEGALQPVRSPIILNGEGYGVFANHSLVLASYLSRAHSAVIDLRELLEQG
ncbi:MAG TPA: DUF2333 family protein [Gammaproteobacteria bacterium]|nr:DUF2333 family protein [Gammaproteobacteria bacterium]